MNPLVTNPWNNIPNQNQSQNQNTTPWWGGSNISGYADAFSSIFSSVKGNPQGPDAINNYYQLPPEEKNEEEEKNASFMKNAIIGLIVIVTLVGGILIFRSSKS